MNTVLRFLGIMLVAGLAARLPGPFARIGTAVVLVVANMLPVWAVATERAGMGDVFLVYWLENVVVWLCGIIRVGTAEGPGLPSGTRTADGSMSLQGFFALHYGIFTLVHGVFAIFMAAYVGLEGGLGQVALLAALIAASHLFSLGVNWFGRDERLVVSPGAALWAPYPRMLVMHVGIILGFILIGGAGRRVRRRRGHGGRVAVRHEDRRRPAVPRPGARPAPGQAARLRQREPRGIGGGRRPVARWCR